VTTGARDDPEAQVAAALAGLRVAPPRAYWWLGRLVQCAPDIHEGVFLARLEDDLYRDFYCTGGEPKPLSREQSAPAVRAAFAEQLADANMASKTWAQGWTVTALHGDTACVERNGLHLFARRDEIRCDGGRIAPGLRVSIALPADRLGMSPGFYVATGRTGDVEDTHEIVRVYLHPTAEAATELVALLSQRLNRAAIPFRLKVVDDPLAFVRCDAAVLFVPRAMFGGARPALRDVVRQLSGRLQPATPALTKALAPGVALAEDPDWMGASFGAHRCRMIAEAVLDEAVGAATPRPARIDAVRTAFARRGLRLEAPYLNAGSSDDYSL
jgi:hypothetical protein